MNTFPWRSIARTLALGACAISVLFIVIPVVSTILGAGPVAIARTVAEKAVMRSFALTFYAALLATALAFAFGLPLAYVLARYEFPGKRLVESLVELPIIIPHTAAGIALLTVFGRRGFLGSAFAPLGVFFTDRLAGIVVAMLFVSGPAVCRERPIFDSTCRSAFRGG